MNKYYECSDITNRYVKYRPTYTNQVAEVVMDYCYKQQKVLPVGNLELMVDVGCGSGMSTNVFQPYFENILGIDMSQKQLNLAKGQNKFNNIVYQEGTAENIAVKDHSVDLVHAATAAEWFNLPEFFDEVKRVLKLDTGCLAICGYRTPKLRLLSNPDEDLACRSYKLLKDVVTNCAEKVKRPQVERGIRLANTRYEEIFDAIPPDMDKRRNDSCHLRYKTSIADVCELISSVESYHLYMRKELKNLKEDNQKVTKEVLATIDPLYQLHEDLLSLWNLEEDRANEYIFEIDFDIFLLLAKKKKCASS